MADPLSITAGIIAVLQATGTVIKYARDVSDATGHKSNLLLELSGTKGILETLKDLVEHGPKEESLLKTTTLLREPLKNYEAVIRKLETGLAPVHGMKRLGKALKWPFEKQDFVEILAAIERYKALFGLALNADTIGLSKAIKVDLDSLRDAHGNQETREILSWLSPINFGIKQRDIFSKHQSGTGQWLLNDQRFMSWHDKHRSTLWCPGVPGAGKTVFASLVIDHLSNCLEGSQSAVLGVYCDYKEYSQQSTSKYVASLLQQLIIARGFVPGNVKAAFTTHSHRQTAPTFPEYLDLLTEQLDAFKRVFVVIDALDECTEANGVRDDLLEGILKLPPLVSVMITSRYIPGIEVHFHEAIQLPITAHEDDVSLHARSCLAKEKTWARRIRLDSALQYKIVKAVIDRANGMFLLAHLHISAIVRKHSRKDLERALIELPEALVTTYDQILHRIDSQAEEDAHLAWEVLSWMTFALQPMQASVLQQALAIRSDDTTFDTDATIHEETFLDVCAGLVVIEEESGLIRFVHHTTQEYFFRIRQRAFPTSPLNIATTCLTFLTFDLDIKRSLDELYTYVSSNWGHHARDSPETAELVELITKFFGNKAAFNDCVERMSAAKSAPKASNDPTSLPEPLHVVAKFDLPLTLKRILEPDSHCNINCRDSRLRTPLWYAVASEHGSVARILLERPDVQIDLPGSREGSPLHNAIASRREDMAQLLLMKGANPEFKDATGSRPIHKALHYNLPNTVQLLLSKGVDVITPSHDGNSPLERAMPVDTKARQKTSTVIRRGGEVSDENKPYIPCLELLLASMDESTINSSDVLFEATKHGRPDIVRVLLTKGADPLRRSEVYNQRIPLHCAAEKGFLEITKLLLEKQSPGTADYQDERSMTALHYAARRGRLEVIPLLIARFKNLDMKSSKSLTPVQYAKIQGHAQVAKTLIAAGARDSMVSIPEDLDMSAIRRRRKESTHSIAFRQSSLNTPVLGMSAPSSPVLGPSESAKANERLLVSAVQGDIEGAMLCLTKGASVTERDPVHDKIPLHWAAEHGHKDIVQLLIEWKSNSASQDAYGETAMHYAANSGYPDVVEVLMRAAPTNILHLRDDRGRTALRCARDNYHLQTVKRMLPMWAITKEDIEERDKHGKNLLHWVAEAGGDRCESLCDDFALLDLDPSSFANLDDYGRSPIQQAEETQNYAMVSILEELQQAIH